MANEENRVRVEKTFRFSAPVLFRALSQGRLFFNCSGDQETFENDFRVGGTYRVFFPSYGIKNVGRYLEIVPDRKLVFTWGDEGSDSHFPPSRVNIELTPSGSGTRLVLEHTGFANRETAEDHNQGWNGGLNDLIAEIEKGQIRIVRTFKVSRQKLYAACSDPTHFFGIVSDAAKGSCDFRVGGRFKFPTAHGAIEGRFEVIEHDERLVFTWERTCQGDLLESRVELRFADEDDGGSSLELIHSGLGTEENIASHREGWSFLTNRLP